MKENVIEVVKTLLHLSNDNKSELKFRLISKTELPKTNEYDSKILTVDCVIREEIDYCKSKIAIANSDKDAQPYNMAIESLNNLYKRIINDTDELFVIVHKSGNFQGIYKFVETEKKLKKYELVYNDDKCGVHLKFHHEVPMYNLVGILDNEVLLYNGKDGDNAFSVEYSVKMEDVVLKNVFYFIEYTYFFDERDVPAVEEIISYWIIRVCAKCGKPFYIPNKTFISFKEHNRKIPMFCQRCAIDPKRPITKRISD